MNAADVDFVIAQPEGYELDPQFVGHAKVEYDQMKALEGADFVYAKELVLCFSLRPGAEYGSQLDGRS
jgi:N-succinyl-L-ornithine transcarbamylase